MVSCSVADLDGARALLESDDPALAHHRPLGGDGVGLEDHDVAGVVHHRVRRRGERDERGDEESDDSGGVLHDPSLPQIVGDLH